MKVLLIIPAYNEQENIEKVIHNIRTFSEQPLGYDLDYIIINDCSTDSTSQICRNNHFPTINLVQNLGIGGAVQTGYLYARQNNYDIAVQFDGDGQHDIHSLNDLLQPLLTDECEFSIGSRFLLGSSSFQSTGTRRLGIRIISGVLRFFSGVTVTDPTSGFRAANKRVIDLFCRYYPVDYPEPESIAFLTKNSIRMKDIQVNMFEREGGVSSITLRKSGYYMLKVILAIVATSFQRKEK